MGFLFYNIMDEIWKTIEGFEDYQVSNFGRVKSLKRNKEKILKNNLNSRGYFTVNLYKDSSNIKSVHQLVAIAFLNHKPCGFKLVVNHKDFNRLNNHVDNLELVTNRENCNLKHVKSSSQYVGVHFDKTKKKYRSRIEINYKKVHLGYFTNEYDAHIAYQNKLKEL